MSEEPHVGAARFLDELGLRLEETRSTNARSPETFFAIALQAVPKVDEIHDGAGRAPKTSFSE